MLDCMQVGLAAADHTIKVCISSGTAAQCKDALEAAYGGGSSDLSFECSLAASDASCLEQVKEGAATLTVVGGAGLDMST
jgi:hypothetical protein